MHAVLLFATALVLVTGAVAIEQGRKGDVLLGEDSAVTRGIKDYTRSLAQADLGEDAIAYEKHQNKQAAMSDAQLAKNEALSQRPGKAMKLAAIMDKQAAAFDKRLNAADIDANRHGVDQVRAVERQERESIKMTARLQRINDENALSYHEKMSSIAEQLFNHLQSEERSNAGKLAKTDYKDFKASVRSGDLSEKMQRKLNKEEQNNSDSVRRHDDKTNDMKAMRIFMKMKKGVFAEAFKNKKYGMKLAKKIAALDREIRKVARRDIRGGRRTEKIMKKDFKRYNEARAALKRKYRKWAKKALAAKKACKRTGNCKKYAPLRAGFVRMDKSKWRKLKQTMEKEYKSEFDSCKRDRLVVLSYKLGYLKYLVFETKKNLRKAQAQYRRYRDNLGGGRYSEFRAVQLKARIEGLHRLIAATRMAKRRLERSIKSLFSRRRAGVRRACSGRGRGSSSCRKAKRRSHWARRTFKRISRQSHRIFARGKRLIKTIGHGLKKLLRGVRRHDSRHSAVRLLKRGVRALFHGLHRGARRLRSGLRRTRRFLKRLRRSSRRSRKSRRSSRRSRKSRRSSRRSRKSRRSRRHARRARRRMRRLAKKHARRARRRARRARRRAKKAAKRDRKAAKRDRKAAKKAKKAAKKAKKADARRRRRL